MGQSLDTMNPQKQSKGELLYELVISGNVEAIKALCREGATLEWIDREGKTPLIAACMSSERYEVAKALIELGANINAYQPGRQGGTPLHHAAKRGLERTVKLLISYGANALVRNDDCQTPLDVARIKGFTNVVRIIENHICHFSGWLRELYGPGFLEALAPQLLSRKIWVVVLPCGSYNPMKPLKLELLIYATPQDAQPRTVITLWKAKIEEPKFRQSDPALVIFDQSTKTRYKLASANEGDKHQLQIFYNACRGVPQVMPPQVIHSTQNSVPASAPETAAEAVELAMALNASIQSALENRPPLPPRAHQSSEAVNMNGWGNTADETSHNGWGSASGRTQSEASSSGWMDEPEKEDYNGWGVPSSGKVGSSTQHVHTEPSNEVAASISSFPSAPPMPLEVLDEGPIHYPSVDFSPVELSTPATENEVSATGNVKDEDGSSSCIICWEAPIQGACIPCGHMAGCMSCLNEIKAKKGACPVCRAKIEKVIRLYAV